MALEGKNNAEIQKKKELSEEIRELAKDPQVEQAVNTMTNKLINKAYSKEVEKLNKIDCSQIYKQIIDKNPDALFFISGNLQLPISQQHFSSLNGIQKMSFMALHTVLNSKEWNKKNYDNTTFQKLIQKEIETMTTIINSRFEWTNLFNANHLATTLREMGITENAIPKVEKYLLRKFGITKNLT